MKLLEVDHLKSVTGKVAIPALSFKASGTIGITPALMKVICPESFETKDTYFLHIYTNDNPLAHPEIGIVIDKNEAQGLKIRFDKSDTPEGRYKGHIIVSAGRVIAEMTKSFDWPLGKDKKPTIRYVYDETSKLADGTPIYILK